MPLRIVPASPAHLDTLEPMVERFHAHEGILLDPAVRRKALLGLLDDPRLGAILLAESDGQPVGYAALAYGYSIEFGGRDAFVDEAWVEPAHRGKGIGTALLDAAARQATQDRTVALHLEVGNANPRAMALYARLGFVAHERHLMTRRLAP